MAYIGIPTNIGNIMIKEGLPFDNEFVMMSMLVDGKANLSIYKGEDVIQFTAANKSYTSISVPTFEKMNVKEVDGWLCILVHTKVRPEKDDLTAVKEVKGSKFL